MQATWSQPVAEAVVFSNDFANRRERPRRPWATSTRQACRMGRKTGCLSSHPTRRTSRSFECRTPPTRPLLTLVTTNAGGAATAKPPRASERSRETLAASIRWSQTSFSTTLIPTASTWLRPGRPLSEQVRTRRLEQHHTGASYESSWGATNRTPTVNDPRCGQLRSTRATSAGTCGGHHRELWGRR